MKYLIISITFLLVVSCDKDKNAEFNRDIMLNNYFSSIIAVNVDNYYTSLDNLKASAGTFTASPSLINLEALRSEFLISYKHYQGIKMLNFGPTEDAFYCSSANIYPCDTTEINTNISTGSYTLGAASNTDAIGFPAIDFLINNGTDSKILEDFTTDEDASNRLLYLTEIIEKLYSEFTPVKAAWGNYRVDFTSATGTDVGSSTGIMFNAYMKDVELLKNAKIGIPSGQQTGGMLLPNYVEGVYGDLSLELAIESCTKLQSLFNGGEGIGLDDYVRHVEGDNVQESLVDLVNNQFDLVISKLASFTSPLSTEITTNSTEVNQTYLEIKKLVTYLKSDVASILGILITYSDSDGD